MKGLEIVMRTARSAGVDICFGNPGTTELPLVEAFDSVSGIRAVLGLFEGVCTGAADGYGRMTQKPAMTLLHLGPGLANGLANLHNAKRARTPVFNVIGEHATWHRDADSPIAMDIASLAGTVSGWVRSCASAESLSSDVAQAISASSAGQVASLIIPHDLQLAELTDETLHAPRYSYDYPDPDGIMAAVRLLRENKKTALILGGRALRATGLEAAEEIVAATDCGLLMETFPAYLDRGAGIIAPVRIPYFPEQAMALLSQYDAFVLVGAREPVAFFGYDGMPSRFLTDRQRRISIVEGDQDAVRAIRNVADAFGLKKKRAKQIALEVSRPDMPLGKLTAEKACAVIAALQPENAIIVDEGITSVASYHPLAVSLPRHSYLVITGGAIGMGMPCSVGAAMACPERPVITLQADGSAMYTLQSLWTQAREGLNVTTLICSNRSYAILGNELARAGNTSPSNVTRSLISLDNPNIGWAQIAKGMGVHGATADTAEKLASELRRALTEDGPHLIDMVLN